MEVLIPDENIFTVECRWKPVIKSFGSSSKKCGRYHGSYFYNMKGFGVVRWPVVGYLLADYEKLRAEGHSDEDILTGCLAYLNTPPPRKKYARTQPKPQYGFLEPCEAKFKKKAGEQYIEVILSTNERKNKNFWGDGRVL